MQSYKKTKTKCTIDRVDKGFVTITDETITIGYTQPNGAIKSVTAYIKTQETVNETSEKESETTR